MNYDTTEEVEAVIAEALASLRSAGIDTSMKFTWSWSWRMTRAMGYATARGTRLKLTFSSRLWPQATPTERRNTIVHELCHIVAGIKHQHGYAWRNLMHILGEPPTTCHKVDLVAAGTKRPYLECPQCGRHFTGTTRMIVKHLGQIARGQELYHRCARTGQRETVRPIES